MEATRDSHQRSIVKTLSWRLLATIITMSVALVITGKIRLAAEIGVIDTLVKIGSYYFHERIWNRLTWGKTKPPEYTL
jgi:uncharacterized membrane protein